MDARPDRVSFTAGVQTTDTSAKAAYRTNAARVQALLGALKARGVAADQMRTSYLDMSMVPGRGKSPRTYNVSNLVTTVREDPGEVGDLIEAAVAAGANNVGNLRFFVADRSRLKEEGLRQAFKDARNRAEAMAKEAGATLGPVVSMTDETVYVEDDLRSELRSLGYVGGSGVESGLQEMNFSVTVVFALEERSRAPAGRD